MAVLRKADSHSVDICRFIKKINNVKEGENLIQTLIFP